MLGGLRGLRIGNYTIGFEEAHKTRVVSASLCGENMAGSTQIYCRRLRYDGEEGVDTTASASVTDSRTLQLTTGMFLSGGLRAQGNSAVNVITLTGRFFPQPGLLHKSALA
jgi:hypothetical protein